MSNSERDFRIEVRSFVRARLPADLRAKVEHGQHLGRPDYVRWYRILHEQGWITPAWAVGHGGTGWTPLQRHIFDEEMMLGGAPRVIAAGIHMLGPVLITFGSDEQKRAHLPAIRRSDVFWAQGFSEPEAGSDLAALRTTAVRDGDHLVVTGHKVWTSYAQFCEMMFALVRTNPTAKTQAGISFILIDLSSKGVTRRPLPTIDGGVDLNEIILDEVRVPISNVVGELDKGWSYAKYLLGFERTGIAGVGYTKQQLQRLKRVAQQSLQGDRPLIEDAAFRERMAALEIELKSIELQSVRMLSMPKGDPRAAVTPSILKIRSTEVRQAVMALMMEAAGPVAMGDRSATASEDDWAAGRVSCAAANYFDARKFSIYGGTNEVQRNVVARELLGDLSRAARPAGETSK